MPTERLETDRLVLRRPRPDDVEAIFTRYASDPDVTRWLSFPTHRTLDDTRAFLALSDAAWAQTGTGPLLIERRADGVLLGSTGLQRAGHRATTGYLLARDAWGQGLAGEALAATVALAGELGVLRLAALVHVDHAASVRVLERGGFEREGRMRRHTVFPNAGLEGPQDVWLYARILG